jgi:hypothetical protein
MKETVPTIEDKVDALLTVLDKDIEYMQDSLSLLNELRSLVIKRDDAALGKLLGSIRTEADSYATNESKRRSIRRELAGALGCNVREMTLSRLETILPEEKKTQVADRRAKLRALAEELKKEHSSTAMFLSECARFNSVLLRTIFDVGKTGTVTYSPNGAAKRQIDTALVNLRF